MDLRKEFNAVQSDLFAWSGDLSRAAARNAIIHMGADVKSRGGYCEALPRGGEDLFDEPVAPGSRSGLNATIG